MYRNLLAEMVRKNITRKDISKEVKCNYASVVEKINGKRSFTIEEATIIKEKFFPELLIDYLFKNFESESQ